MAATRSRLTLTPARIVLVIIVATAAVRVVLAAVAGLGIDEAYTVGNARILSLSYVDHPPLHYWLVHLMTWLTGSERALAVRLPFIALFAGSTWLTYRLGRVLYDERAGMWAAIWLNLAPVFSIVHGGAVLPDGPLIFFLLAAANVLAGLLFAEPKRPLLAWAGAGALAGLALLSKYTAVFLFAGTFVFLLSVPRQRRWLATPGPWLALAIAVVVFAPAIVWNLQHGLGGFAFQASRATESRTSFGNLFKNIGGQMIYLTPWLFVPLAVVLGRALVRGRREERSWFLALLAIGPVVAFTVLALWSPGQPHWPMPGWLFALILPPLVVREVALRRFAAGSAVVLAVVAVAFGLQVSGHGLSEATLRRWHIPDPTLDITDWTALPAALAERGLLGPDTVVAASNWRPAGKASYALGPNVPVLCLCRQPHHFPFRVDVEAVQGRDVILIGDPADDGSWWPPLGQSFDLVEPLPPVMITRAGEPVMALPLAIGRHFHLLAEKNSPDPAGSPSNEPAKGLYEPPRRLAVR